MRLTLQLLTALLCAVFATSASAFVAPVTSMDDTYFLTQSVDWRVDMVDLHIVQEPGAPSNAEWILDAELSIRHASLAEGPAPVVILDDEAFTDETVAYVNGEPIDSEEIVLRQDPAMPEHTYPRARLIRVPVQEGAATIVRVRMRTRGTIDSLGQIFVELPTHAMGLFEGEITGGTMRVEFLGRPLGFQATLVGGVAYDDPISEVTWRLRDWAPRIPFRTSFLTPWSALLLVAEVESCPDPWRVVRAVTGGDVDALRTYANHYDDPTLEFCGNLPEILHGRWFDSDRTREQLAGMTLDRYVAGAQPVSLYQPNAHFSSAQLGDAEAIYARSLRSVLSARQ